MVHGVGESLAEDFAAVIEEIFMLRKQIVLAGGISRLLETFNALRLDEESANQVRISGSLRSHRQYAWNLYILYRKTVLVGAAVYQYLLM